MSKQCLEWDTMFQALLDFQKRMGHCSVPANCKRNPRLGRWVAAVRLRHKLEELPTKWVKMLDSVGFVWSPSAVAWNERFNELVEFKNRHGHCNVPTQWKQNRSLANWVATQRRRRKLGALPTDRVRCMEALGFQWSIYGQNGVGDKTHPTGAHPRRRPEERLYVLGRGEYVQYNGAGEMPGTLRKFVELNQGELPPFIPLPGRPTSFYLGEHSAFRHRKGQWPGKGPLPKAVFDFVCENGVLPPHN